MSPTHFAAAIVAHLRRVAVVETLRATSLPTKIDFFDGTDNLPPEVSADSATATQEPGRPK